MTEPATTPAEDELWRVEFGVEVSTLYHDWRRRALGTVVNIVRVIALISAVISLGSAFIAVTYSGVAIAGAAATVVTLIDLIFQFDSRARLHDDLYRRFKSLQADIARHRAEAERYISEWDAKSQEIRVDEPPVYWSAACWNQAAERRRAPKEYIRSISLRRVLAGKYLLFHFRPNDFPVGA
jgi:hypothetical protein